MWILNISYLGVLKKIPMKIRAANCQKGYFQQAHFSARKGYTLLTMYLMITARARREITV